MQQVCEKYDLWKENVVLADCLSDLGYKEIASTSLLHDKSNFRSECLKLVVREARTRKNNDIIDRLAFAGLIYS